MNRWTVLLVALVFSALIAMSCSGGGGNPMTPDTPNLTNGTQSHGATTQTHLWGYFDVHFDLENMTVEAVPNRNMMWTANVVQFVNLSPANLAFEIWGTPLDPGGTYVDVDIDVSITHPFPGIHQYDGYDVRGIFMSRGSVAMGYGNGLIYADEVADQFMKDYNPDGTNPDYVDPYLGPYGDPDGYTRWFNESEFTIKGPLGYTEGVLASKEHDLSATLNPYKYFADGLGPTDDLWTWLGENADFHGIYAAGSVNTRNYYLRFPTPDPNVTYGYAITANWGEPGAEDDPALFVDNAVEAIACDVDTDNHLVYYVDEGDNGGTFIADIDIWGWDYEDSVAGDGVYMPSNVYVESSLFSGVYQLPPGDMIPTGGGANWSTYHTEIPATNVTDNGIASFWVIAEYPDYTYDTPYSVEGTYPAEPLAAFFRFELDVLDEAPCDPPVVNGINPAQGAVETVVNCDIDGEFDAGGATAQLIGTMTIDGENVVYVDANTINADFDLTGADLGIYDLRVTHADCSAPTYLDDAFEIIDVSGPALKTSGDLPTPYSTSNIVDFSVQGVTGFGYPGVYYFQCSGTIYQIYKYPLDYSGVGTAHCTVSDPFFGNVPGLMGGAQYPETIEVMANGPVVWTSSYTGPMTWGSYPGDGPVWWCGPDGVLDNGYLYFNMEFHDNENGYGATDRLMGFWGNNPAGVDGASYYLNAPYGAYDYGSYTGYYPADHAGGVDGQVSDNEADRYTWDNDPEGLSSPFNCVHYYMEVSPDPYGIECMENVVTLAFPVSLATIDDNDADWNGTPVDITSVPTFGNAPSASSNWLCILEDNGDTTWSFSCWDQNGNFIGRVGPYDGTPFATDADMVNCEAHVWCDDGGTWKYYIFQFF